MRDVPKFPNLRIGHHPLLLFASEKAISRRHSKFLHTPGQHLNPFVINSFEKNKLMTTLSTPGNEK
jgi:hypothetical protein